VIAHAPGWFRISVITKNPQPNHGVFRDTIGTTNHISMNEFAYIHLTEYHTVHSFFLFEV